MDDEYLSLLARLPQADDAEYTLAGHCLYAAPEALQAAHTTHPDDYHDPWALAIIQTCLNLDHPDPIQVKHILTDNNPGHAPAVMDAIGKALHLAAATIPATAPAHAKLITDTAEKRRQATQALDTLTTILPPREDTQP